MKLVIVVPCYNEEAVLQETTRQLIMILDELLSSRKINEGCLLYVDDGSKDSTWSQIETYSEKDCRIFGLKLAHNSGHQSALWAGLEWTSAHADVIVSIDADLQDDVHSIVAMVDAYIAGADIVFGVRKERKTDTFFKRHTALAFYRLMNAWGGDIVYNHADFRLMSKAAILALMQYPERNLFIRGMVSSLGFSTAKVYYDRHERFAGESKYPLKKMISFALDGITSFSVKPLRFIGFLGLLFIFISITVIIYALFAYLSDRTIAGWTSLLVSVWFIGGSILMALGIIGEYIGKIYKEVKRRPRYIVEKVVGKSQQSE